MNKPNKRKAVVVIFLIGLLLWQISPIEMLHIMTLTFKSPVRAAEKSARNQDYRLVGFLGNGVGFPGAERDLPPESFHHVLPQLSDVIYTIGDGVLHKVSYSYAKRYNIAIEKLNREKIVPEGGDG